MGLFNPLREGSWWLTSESDNRWNVAGRGLVGGLVMPEECNQKLTELKQRFGEPPEDLVYGYIKD